MDCSVIFLCREKNIGTNVQYPNDELLKKKNYFICLLVILKKKLAVLCLTFNNSIWHSKQLILNTYLPILTYKTFLISFFYTSISPENYSN